jgi:hypothetical protein
MASMLSLCNLELLTKISLFLKGLNRLFSKCYLYPLCFFCLKICLWCMYWIYMYVCIYVCMWYTSYIFVCSCCTWYSSWIDKSFNLESRKYRQHRFYQFQLLRIFQPCFDDHFVFDDHMLICTLTRNYYFKKY